MKRISVLNPQPKEASWRQKFWFELSEIQSGVMQNSQTLRTVPTIHPRVHNIVFCSVV